MTSKLSMRKRVVRLVASFNPAIRINTDEYDDALNTIAEICTDNRWVLFAFDLTNGLQSYDPNQRQFVVMPNAPASTPARDPFAAAASTKKPDTTAAMMAFMNGPTIKNELLGKDDPPVNQVLCIKNFHLAFEGSNRAERSSLLQELISKGKKEGKTIIGFTPAEAKLPPEIQPLLRVVEHELPNQEELLVLLDTIAFLKDHEPFGSEKELVARAALGLTRTQAQNVFTECNLKERIRPVAVAREKVDIINREQLVTVYEGTERFADVGGLAGAKKRLTALLKYDADDTDPDSRAKGILLVGGPGTGKSLMCKCLGNETNRPVLQVHPGNLRGGFVGDTERNMRKMFQLLRALAPAIAFIDEVEKLMPSSKNTAMNSNVDATMEGTFLVEMNDMKEDIFWAFSANSIELLHEAFTRAERIDMIFRVGLPGPKARAAIWKLYLAKFFPKELNGKANPRYLSQDLDEVLAEHGDPAKEFQVTPDMIAAKRAEMNINGTDQSIVNLMRLEYWANKFGAALMCIPADERDAAAKRLTDIKADLIHDEQFTGAEIRSVCRLARRLKVSLLESSKLVRPVALRAPEAFQAVDTFSNGNCIDAETGEVFILQGGRNGSSSGKKRYSSAVEDN